MILNKMRIRTILFGVLLSAIFPVTGARAQGGDVAVARRIAALTASALKEYDAGVEMGRIFSREELDEATSFVDEARRKAGDLSVATRPLAAPALDSLAAGVRGLHSLRELQDLVAGMRHRLEIALQASL